MTPFDYGVVIPVGPGRQENLVAVLQCLEEQARRPTAVVLVHDGADAWGVVSGHTLPLLQIPAAKHEPGMEQPRNVGVRAMAENWPDLSAVWFLDTDVIVGRGCAEVLAEAWEASETGRVLLAPYDWLPPGVRQIMPSLHNDPRWPMFEEKRWDADLGTSVGELNVGLGCFSGNLVWPIAEFTRIGGFWNEIHHGRCEDGELGLRAVAHGVPMACVQHARGWHLDHKINVERGIRLNTRDVPMINARHPWVQGQGVFVVERDGRRFEQRCPTCGDLVNTLDYWSHQSGHAAALSTTVLSTSPHWDGYYVAPNGDEIPYYRCDGRLICWDCWRPYGEHPCDEQESCLTVLCNGWRVKL